MEFQRFSKLLSTDSGQDIIPPTPRPKFWGFKGAGILPRCSTTGRYLLGYRSAEVNEGHSWGLFGGAIEGKEHSRLAALREFREETKYKGRINTRLLYVHKDEGFRFYNYLGHIKEEFIPILDWENEKAEWFALEDFPKPLHFGIRKMMPILNKLEDN
jgi:8-oxo-dGTP pyrophosphatase MutT (NUDIX family)